MTLQLYILRQLALATALVGLALSVVLLPTMALTAFLKLGAVGLGVVLAYLPLTFVDFVPYLFPMAFLLALVGTYGRMAQERELVAARMAGIHPGTLCLPALALALVGGAASHYLLANRAPGWRFEQRSFRHRAEALAFEGLAPGRTELEFGGGSLVALERSGNRFLDVMALLPGEEDDFTLLADSAELSVVAGRLTIEFEGARVLGDRIHLFDEFPVWSMPLSELFPSVPGAPVRPKYFRSEQLTEALATDTTPANRRAGWAFELHHRRALSMIYLVFLSIGVPLGVGLRAGGLVGGYLRATALAFAYFAMAMQLGKSLVLAETLPPLWAAWLTNAVFLCVGGVLSFRALFK